MIHKIISRAKEVGIKNLIIGIMKVPYYKILQKKYHFSNWHLTPYELREYVQIVAAYVNKQNAGCVVDLGCGLGELIRHIKAKKRIGIDIQDETIGAAKHLHGHTDIEFRKGTFEELGTGQDIDYLITLGFMHGSPHEVWQPLYTKACKENNIKYVIVDSTKTTEESYFLDFSKILPSEYKKCKQFGPLLGGRYVYIYKKEEK